MLWRLWRFWKVFPSLWAGLYLSVDCHTCNRPSWSRCGCRGSGSNEPWLERRERKCRENDPGRPTTRSFFASRCLALPAGGGGGDGDGDGDGDIDDGNNQVMLPTVFKTAFITAFETVLSSYNMTMVLKTVLSTLLIPTNQPTARSQSHRLSTWAKNAGSSGGLVAYTNTSNLSLLWKRMRSWAM